MSIQCEAKTTCLYAGGCTSSGTDHQAEYQLTARCPNCGHCVSEFWCYPAALELDKIKIRSKKGKEAYLACPSCLALGKAKDWKIFWSTFSKGFLTDVEVVDGHDGAV